MDHSFYHSLAILWLLITTVEPIIDGEGVHYPCSLGDPVAFIDNGVNTWLDYRFCTGALVTRTMVLTSAYCCKVASPQTRVRLGSYKFLSHEGGLQFSRRSHRIIGVGLDLNYDKSGYWQLCVIQLTQPVPYHIVPFAMPLRTEYVAKTENNIYGYGFGSVREDELVVYRNLQLLYMPGVDRDVCWTTYKAFIKVAPRNLNLTLYPCYGYTGKKNKMVEFDMGGPIIDIKRRRLRAISLSNIPSERPQAEKYPTFAADVAYFRAEIDAAIRELNLS